MPRLFLTVLFLVGASSATHDSLWGQLPEGLPDVSTWQQISGDYEGRHMAARYLLYVNPRRSGIYEVIRYRLRFLEPATETERHYRPTEKLVWNEPSGLAHSFECASQPAGETPLWREMSHDSMEFKVEMQMIIQLMGLHGALLRQREGH